MTEPDKIPDLISIGTQEMADTAKRLGLTWTLRPATVAGSDPLTIIYDGDISQTIIGAESLDGFFPVGARVMAMFVPPSGNFVIGTLDDTSGMSTYTPVLTSSGTGITPGSSISTGRYTRIGRLIELSIRYEMGAGFAAGTGAYTFNLPVRARTIADHSWVGAAYLRDASAGSTGHFAGFSHVDSALTNGNTTLYLFSSTNSAQVGATIPFAWTNGDFINATIVYEIE